MKIVNISVDQIEVPTLPGKPGKMYLTLEFDQDERQEFDRWVAADKSLKLCKSSGVGWGE